MILEPNFLFGSFLNLGKVKLFGFDFNKLILAPMAEISDAAFRKISRKFGAGLTFTQMVSAEGVVRHNFTTMRYLSFARSEKPIGVQVLGNDPKLLGRAVKEILKFNPDVIDLNSGCPVSKVTSNKMGASLMEDPKHLGKLINSMVKSAGGTPVSVKFRLGKDLTQINIIESAKAAEDNGASFITVHLRTSAARYNEAPNYEWITKIKNAIKIPVVANGSIFTLEDALFVKKNFNPDGLMIARGALGNPFLFQRYNTFVEKGFDPGPPDLSLVKKTLFEHINLLRLEFGEFLALDKAKKHSLWYLRDIKGISSLLKNIFAIKDIDSLYELLENHFNSVQNNIYIEEDRELIRQKFFKRVVFWLLEDNLEMLSKTA